MSNSTILQNTMNNAHSYEQWRIAAQTLDLETGAFEWRKNEASDEYEYALLHQRKDLINNAIARKDIFKLVFHLKEGIHGNLGNIASPKLYMHSAFGTKFLIEEYLKAVCDALVFLCSAPDMLFPHKKKFDFFTSTAQAFGRSALMLSGGATLGLFHIGVAKALWQQGLLPNIISGSSSGSIIAGVIGTHSDEELMEKLTPENLDLNAFKFINWKSILRGRPFLDGEHLEENINLNIPDLTFLEAFEKTGRQINITVSPFEKHQAARMLNWRTSPNVLIRKAVLASCAIPQVYPPVTLAAKNMQGEIIPYAPTRKWVDGSVKDDLPVNRLARLYGVNHTIVSQTNPHITPFLARSLYSSKSVELLRNWISTNIQTNLEMSINAIQTVIPYQETNLSLDKIKSIVTQSYSGDINIIPPRQPLNVFKALKNPSKDTVHNFIETGERSTWPIIERVRNTTQISRTFEQCINQLRKI